VKIGQKRARFRDKQQAKDPLQIIQIKEERLGKGGIGL